MARTLADARQWVAQGTALISEQLAGLDDAALAAPSGLPGWTRKHLLAHLAANADALGHLVHWAATGVETPMYSSSQQRSDDIEAGARLADGDLRAWFARSAEELSTSMDALTPAQWQVSVRTAQGREVSASATAWMRAREVFVHAVDLDTGVGFADLPEEFLRELGANIRTMRGLGDGPADGFAVEGSLAEVTAYLAGRPNAATVNGRPAPPLPPWL